MLEILKGLTVTLVRDEELNLYDHDEKGDIVYTVLDTYLAADGHVCVVVIDHEDLEFYDFKLEQVKIRLTTWTLAYLKSELSHGDQYVDILEPKRDDPVATASDDGDSSPAAGEEEEDERPSEP